MSVTIEKNGIRVERANDLDRWNDYVERSPHGDVFHRLDALRVQAEHTGATLHPLVGYKGQEPVGLFPAFTISKGGVTTAFSPPPNLWLPHLGPVLLNMEKLKRRKAERRHRRFIDGCLDWLDSQYGPKYVHVRTGGRYEDIRPFEWNEFEVLPRHTYEVDLTPGEENVLSSFSSDARSNTRTDEDRYDIRVGGVQAIRRIIRQVKARHNEQDEPYRLSGDFVADLYQSLPDGAVRPYVCDVDGEFAGGMIALADDERIYRWQGGAKHDHDVPINDLVDWAIMRDAMDEGIPRYDLVGANERRLCGYKAKFNPELVRYYSLERGTRMMNLLTDVYKRFR
ncbi:lipid II:glycine glycyltransferase FemX [Haladaptatus caseinilyticus]|uniref:lipid II:glycine glycyltransferase FemX n=1 Tax=Haladaptatus caseinilyticus TaxID=2993314 RepID=UPI00224B25B4|nr:GNAT family N-acetyltransferase [Haladaptatus caseinilyticus]